MNHNQRWTAEKIGQRIELLESLVYCRREALPDWRYLGLESPADPAYADPGLDDSDWPALPAYSAWGEARVEFVLRTRFIVPHDWHNPRAVALFLPIGIANDFSHPETLAYIDGAPVSSCDRHHQEVRVPPSSAMAASMCWRCAVGAAACAPTAHSSWSCAPASWSRSTRSPATLWPWRG